MNQQRYFRERLEHEEKVLSHILGQSAQSLQLTAADMSEDYFQSAQRQAEHRRAQLRLSRIRNALSRLDQGEFGYCCECGEEISHHRLESEPTEVFCHQCRKKAA